MCGLSRFPRIPQHDDAQVSTVRIRWLRDILTTKRESRSQMADWVVADYEVKEKDDEVRELRSYEVL